MEEKGGGAAAGGERKERAGRRRVRVIADRGAAEREGALSQTR